MVHWDSTLSTGGIEWQGIEAFVGDSAIKEAPLLWCREVDVHGTRIESVAACSTRQTVFEEGMGMPG